VSSSVAVAGHGHAVAPARVGLGPPRRGAIEKREIGLVRDMSDLTSAETNR